LVSFAISDDIDSTKRTLTVLVGEFNKNKSQEVSEKSIENNTERNIHFILSLLVTTNIQEILVVKLSEIIVMCSEKTDSSQDIVESLELQVGLILDLLIQILKIEMGKALFPKMLINAKSKVNNYFDFESVMEYLLNKTRNSSLTLRAISILVLLEADLKMDYFDDIYSSQVQKSLCFLIDDLENRDIGISMKDQLLSLLSVLPIEKILINS
jgi:hypothetical protein